MNDATRRFVVEERHMSEALAREYPDLPRTTYHVIDTETGKAVPFGGYGGDRDRAQARADREEAKISTVRLLPRQLGDPVNRLVFSDGRVVVCTHDGAPCPGCQIPRELWPKVWEPGFLTMVEPEAGP